MYRWEAADVDGEIIVGVEGHSVHVQLEPGENVSDITLTLPLGDLNRQVTVTSFTFERWNDSGQACFVWQERNERDREFYLDPGERDDA